MKYQSTRGEVQGWTFEQALFAGHVSDGGLIVPETIPTIDQSTLKSWSKLSYVGLMKEIVPLFVGDEVPSSALNELLDKAFTSFTSENIVEVKHLSEHLNILELFHGPTYSFKDMPLRVAGQMIQYFMEKEKQHTTVLIATAGNTGSSGIEAVRGLKSVDIIVLLPTGRISKVQELQMTTAIDDNVHVYRGDATSDDLSNAIKSVFNDAEFCSKYRLCCFNSVNWARVMLQIPHLFYAYFQLCPDVDGEVEVIIPTGGCGNVTSGIIAREMGLPVKLVCTVTNNNMIERTLNHGDCSILTHVTTSLAFALDTGSPYNMERMMYILSIFNSKLVKQLMNEIRTTGQCNIPEYLLETMRKVIQGYVVDDEGIKSAMVQCWQKNKYMVCPHTATAVKYHYDICQIYKTHLPRICVATASPLKFEEAILSAGLTPQSSEALTKLCMMKTKYIDLNKEDDVVQLLKSKILEINEKAKNK